MPTGAATPEFNIVMLLSDAVVTVVRKGSAQKLLPGNLRFFPVIVLRFLCLSVVSYPNITYSFPFSTIVLLHSHYSPYLSVLPSLGRSNLLPEDYEIEFCPSVRPSVTQLWKFFTTVLP